MVRSRYATRRVLMAKGLCCRKCNGWGVISSEPPRLPAPCRFCLTTGLEAIPYGELEGTPFLEGRGIYYYICGEITSNSLLDNLSADAHPQSRL